tara:strand:- start:1228 stop:1962 length:735 start_codon:yes stop_codon:yes gene_type:complete
MDIIDLLDKNTIYILERNELLLPLIKKELTATLVSSNKLNDQEITNIKNDFIRSNNFESEITFNNWLTKNNINESEFLKKLSHPIKYNKYAIEHFHDKVNSYFLKKKNNFDLYTYSLIRHTDQFLIQELYLRIKGKEAHFSELAKEYSMGQEKQSMGVVGPAPISNANKVIADYLSSAKEGDLLEPLKIGQWWLIVKLEIRQEATLTSELEQNIANELFDKWLDQECNTLITEVKSKIKENENK